MRKFVLLLAAAALLVTPVRASDGPDSRSPDPDTCQHRFQETAVIRANCSQPGLTAYTCALCGFTYTEQTAPNGEHDYALTDTTATCTQPGEAVYTCTLCGDTYTEAVPAAGHVPEEESADCLRPRLCTVCGEVLEPAVGHDYVYQYDAKRTDDGQFLSYGTWRCDRCGSTMAATRGNAEYYYGQAPQPEADAEDSGTDLVLAGDGNFDDDSPTDGAADTAEPDGDGSRQTGLWLAISAGVLAFIVIEAVLLVRSLRKSKTTI